MSELPPSVQDRTYACVQEGCPNHGVEITIKGALIGDGAYMTFNESIYCTGCGAEPRIKSFTQPSTLDLDMAMAILQINLDEAIPTEHRHLIAVAPDALRIVLASTAPRPGSLASCGRCTFTQPHIQIAHGCPTHDPEDTP